MRKELPLIRIELENEQTGSTFSLMYELFTDTQFPSRWVKLLEEALQKRYGIQDGGIFYGGILVDEDHCVQEMTRVVGVVNDHIKQKGLDEQYLIQLVPHKGMSQDFLNRMHERFEELRPNPLFMKPNAKREVEEALRDLNTLIHRCEGLLSDDAGCHIEINFNQVSYGDFEEKDWYLFTPDKRFGYLYLTYGVTGVPIEAAYYARPESPPLPQPNYCSGFSLYFHEDADFSEWEQLGKWLDETYGWDVNDPKMAIGYIPLGRLISQYESEEKLIAQIAQHQKVKQVSLVHTHEEMAEGGTESMAKTVVASPNWWQRILGFFGLTTPEVIEHKGSSMRTDRLSNRLVSRFPHYKYPPATWVAHPELKYHLDYRPYIVLDMPFDPKPMLKEAKEVLECFVAHRNYDQSSDDGAKWKSIGIQSLNGDYTKTSYHTNYGVHSSPNYMLTEIADRCPETVKFLCSVTEIGQCERIRFMLLEPGARIRVHKDSGEDVCVAVNISLNMPKGCVFKADVNEDGSDNPYSVSLPFSNEGSVILFNNAKYHYVYNDSEEDRIHIILHGPVRRMEKDILADARKQNGFTNRREVLQGLIKKKSLLGDGIQVNSQLYRDWKTLGLGSDAIPENIALVVLDIDVPNNLRLQAEALHNITLASLFPLSYTIVKAEAFDQWLLAQEGKGYSHIVIIAAGSLFLDNNQLILELFQTFSDMAKQGAMIAGHIINQPKEIPYLHEQFAVLDYRKWVEAGKHGFGRMYGQVERLFPAYSASKENIHDDYTPLYIEAGHGSGLKRGKEWWGTNLLAQSIEANMRILNLSHSLRNLKMFAYPNGNENWQYKEVKAKIDENLAYIQRQVFFFNNETLRMLALPNYQPDVLVSVAAGFKYLGIMDQYWRGRPLGGLHFVDYSEHAIRYVKGLLKGGTGAHIFEYVKQFMQEHPYGTILDDEGIQRQLGILFKEIYESDVTLAEASFAQAQSATFEQGDFVSKHSLIVDRMSPHHKTIMWHSNAWSCNGILYKMSRAEIESNYLALIKKVKAKLGLKAWKYKYGFEALFGESWGNVHSVLTDGGDHHQALKQWDWEEV